jgi:hypothetical protein
MVEQMSIDIGISRIGFVQRCTGFVNQFRTPFCETVACTKQKPSETACRTTCAHFRWPLTPTIAWADLLSIGSSRISKNAKIPWAKIYPTSLLLRIQVDPAELVTMLLSCSNAPYAIAIASLGLMDRESRRTLDLFLVTVAAIRVRRVRRAGNQLDELGVGVPNGLRPQRIRREARSGLDAAGCFARTPGH